MSSLCVVAQQTVGTSNADSITGRVVNEAGQPLPNAAVYVQAVGIPRVSEPATTDRDGRFKVTGLQPVSYTIHVTMPAYVSPSILDPESRSKQYKVGDSVTFVLIKGGVITGTVRTAAGDPLVGVNVRARMIRDDKGRRIGPGLMLHQIPTDDRGVYRIYGLLTGTYIVVAGGHQGFGSHTGSAFEADIPTYAPSSTRDTAAEISVRSGEETTNIDIRYRGEPGRTISGVARRTSVAVDHFGVSVSLSTAGAPDSSQSYHQQSENSGFVFFGLPDGDYSLTAQSHVERGELEISETRFIKVRGADVEGIELTTKPMASITGRVVLEELKAPECNDKDRPAFKDMFISAWHRQTEEAKKIPQFIWNAGQPASADAQGNIKLRNLASSQYYFAARFPAKFWYVQSITLTAPGKVKPIDATRVWTSVSQGEKLSGLTVTLAQGAGTLNGQITLREGETLPERIAVYLVPAEKERADDILRFYGAAVSREGKIAMNSIAPGRYWVLAQAVTDEAEAPIRKLRWPDETEMRAQLRRDAEAAKTEIQLKPCQNVVDFKVPVRQD
ncbi:MAG TPA: carboxypeptidase-like regulatory domain-containing protein [Pyrinomonadaceae bacterium]|nr:carboxypeptidase-like regulatory domain-containing protein [Pyrinomonadaceae bacterium]